MFTVQYDKDNVSLWGTGHAGLLSAHYKRLGFPKLGVPMCVQHPLWPLIIHLHPAMELGARVLESPENKLLLLIFSELFKKSFVPGPGVLCLLLASVQIGSSL